MGAVGSDRGQDGEGPGEVGADSGVVGGAGRGASQGKHLLFTGKPRAHFDLLTF